MAFLEQRIDTRITRGAMGGPSNPGRTKVYTPDGKLRQNFLAAYPIHKYDVSHGVRTHTDFQTVLDLWYVVNFTPYEGFRFKDWRDFQATQLNSRCTLITTGVYQLNRVHKFGSIEFLRPIYKPVSSTVVVYRTRAGSVTTASATIDYTTGQATITGHVSGDTYTWSGEFDVPVTFVNDEWADHSLEVTTDNLHIQVGSIQLEEIRL